MNAAEITYDFVAAREALDADVTITSSGTSAGKNGMGTDLVYPNELSDLFKGNFAFFFRNECTVKLTSEGLVMNGSKDTYISVLNLKEGDKVTVDYTGSILFCDNPVTNIEGITDQWTQCTSGTTYTLTADGNFNIQWKKSKTVITKITVETTATETVSAPGIAVTGVSGINRTVTITPGLGSMGSAVSTYYTINGDDPNNTSEAYAAPFTLSETATVKAVSMLADGTSSPITSLEVTAGESIKLIANATLTDITEVGSSYAFSVTNTNLIGTPSISFSYTYGDIAGEGATYTAAGAGKLCVIASAEGYESSDALETTVYEYEVGESLSLKDANVLAEDDAAWTYNSEGTRYANWSGYNGVSKAAYPYWTPAANGQGAIGNFIFEPGENVLMRTIGFIHNSGTQNLSIVGLPENAKAKFVVSTYLSNPFNVFVDATEGTATYGIGAGNTGYAVEAVQLYTKKVPPFDPATAIVNAGFNPEADPLGWDKVTSGSFFDLGMGLIGTYQVRGEHPVATVDETHLATEFAAGLECRWQTNYAAFTQTTAELPAGAYKLTFDVENTNATTTKANYENRFNVTVGETTYADESTEWMDGKSAWTTHTIAFTLTEASPITISLGYGTGSNNFGVGNTPALFVSHLTLEAINSIEIALIDLQAAIEAAQAKAATYTVGTEFFTYAESEIKPLNDAIATAQAAYTAAESAEAVKSATETLNAFVATFAPVMNKPAADKEYVITNKTAELALSIGNEAVKIEKEGIVKFTEVAGGWVLSNNAETPEYIFKTTANTWTFSTTANKDEAYVVNFNLADGAYTIQGANGLFGTDNTAEGSAVYANKAQSNNGLWIIKEGPVDVTNLIVNADLTSTDPAGFDANGTKGIDGSGIVKVGSAAAFDFNQTIANLPAGKYKVTAQAAYRYGADEAAEAAAIAAETDTKLVQLYATVGEKTVSAKVQNRYDGASETDYANGTGSVTVNEKFVPNSSDAVKAWFAAGKYVNELVFNVPADGAVTIGINRTGTPESDYTVIGPWTLTRLGDAEVEPGPEPEPTPEPGADMTAKIVNPSFETGDLTGWTVGNSSDTGVKPNSNATYTTEGVDGNYLFNTWWQGLPITQTVKNLPNGLYELKALMANDAITAGNQPGLYLLANGEHSAPFSSETAGKFAEGSMQFYVLDGTATIGAIGGNADGTFNAGGYYWYKADNFRLTYVAALPNIDDIEIPEGKMSVAAANALTTAKESGDLKALLEAVKDAKASIEAYAKFKGVYDYIEAEIANTNLYSADAKAKFDQLMTDTIAKYNDGTLADEAAAAFNMGERKAGIIPELLLSVWTAKAQDIPYINTWSTEGNNDGSNFFTPFFEYWVTDANSLPADTLTATMSGLEAGDYDVTAWVRVRMKNGVEAPATGITMQANDGEAVDVAAGDQVGTSQMYLKEFTATGTVTESGELKIKFIVAADNNISWLSFKNVMFEKKAAAIEPIEGISYSWESPAGEPIEWGGTIAYVNGEGNRLNYLNSGYYTICLNGKKVNLTDTVASANAGKMVITLDKAVAEGDTIAYTAYITKDKSATAAAYILFENGTNVNGAEFGDAANIHTNFNGVPQTDVIVVPAGAAGSKTITLTRGQTGTNLFITKLQIIEKAAETEPQVDSALIAAKEALEATIAAAKAIETEGKNGADALNAAITPAETALTAADATVESLTAAKEALAQAISVFNKANLDADLVEIAQNQGKDLDTFTRTDLVEGAGYNTYTANGDLNIAIKMVNVDVKDCDYVVIKFAEPVAAGWHLAFWSNQDLVDVPAGATEFKYVFANDPNCGVSAEGVLPQICMMTFFGGFQAPLEAKIVGIYKHNTVIATGINTIANDAQKNTIFNLNGQKVNKAQRGLYIINGKRVMVK